MPLLRLNGFLPGGLTWIILFLPCFMIMTLLLSVPKSDVKDEEESLTERLSKLEDRLAHLHHMDEAKKNAFISLQAQMAWVADLTERSNMTLLQLASKGNQTVTRMLLYNLTHASGPASLSLPKMVDFMPHLLYYNSTALQPALKLSRNRKSMDIVIGIPTIKRDKVSYLVTTLRSLIDNLDTLEKQRVVIVVFIGELGLTQYVTEQVTLLKLEFGAVLASGLLEIVVPPALFYPPDLDSIAPTFNDSPQRMTWRTKQNLDYAYLMMYAQAKARYYLQLEDDVITKPNYMGKVLEFTSQQSRLGHWFLLEFSSLGFIGKLFRTSDLSLVINFILMFHRDKPVDWLLDHILYVKVCNPEKTPKQCNVVKAKYRIRHKPSLFQHIGVHSSLAGKMQKLKEKDFGKQSLHIGHPDNPQARCSTSLKIYQKYTLDRAYGGETFFWALVPTMGDWVKFELTPPVRLEGYRFRSGNPDHPDDMFYNTTVEIKSQSPELGQYPLSSDGWRIVGSFASSGGADGHLNTSAVVEALRLVIHAPSTKWLILNEIWIRTLK